MGNTNHADAAGLSTKHKVLSILRASSLRNEGASSSAEQQEKSALSGQTIASLIGVSRVSVWKAIRSLQNAGYEITSGKNGYTLHRDIPDSLNAWEFEKNEQVFTHFAVTDSTMTEARKIAQAAVSSFNQTESSPSLSCRRDIPAQNSIARVVTADSQIKGQGRGEHSWTTTEGSLACTLVTFSRLPVAASHRLTMAAQIALTRALKSKSERHFFPRWPNDVYSESGKVAGILDELSSRGGVCLWINIGLGVNITSAPGISGADCAVKAGEKPLLRKELLSLFCEEFESRLLIAAQETSRLADEWNSLCEDTGKTLSLQNGSEALFKGIDGLGRAELTLKASGQTLSALPGTLTFQKRRAT